jgi:hypothetical protein
MTTLSIVNPTLADVSKRLDPDGKIATIAEILNLTNPILDDMTMIEGNLPTGHKSTTRTGLPSPTWRKLYGGVQPTKSRTAQVVDSTGMLEAYAEVDKALADLNGNTAAFRLSEDKAHIEGMSQEQASTLIYGNESTEPEAFTGLAPRFNSLSAQNGGNILQSGTTPDTSIWLIVWGDNLVHGIYPKGSMGGLQVNDKGQVTIESIDGAGGRMEAYRSHYRWDCGLVVRDWRYVVRIQVDTSEIVKAAATGPDLIDLMAQAIDLVPSLNSGRPVFYANRAIRGFLRRQMMNKVVNSTLTLEHIKNGFGQTRSDPTFDGIPVKRCDAILGTETAVS